MYEARKICNLLLAHADATSTVLTNLRMNKLLYFIHGWGLTRRPEGFVRNHFEAWQHGPVIRSVFDTFKGYAESKIMQPAKFLDYSTGQITTVGYDDISAADIEVIMRIYSSYEKYTTYQLVDFTHEPDGPWDATYKRLTQDKRSNSRIQNSLIREHFMKKAGGNVRH